MLSILISLCYFLIVFIGLFIVHNEYSSNNLYFANLSEGDSNKASRVLIIIEIVLLIIIIGEMVVKLACTTRQTKQVGGI